LLDKVVKRFFCLFVFVFLHQFELAYVWKNNCFTVSVLFKHDLHIYNHICFKMQSEDRIILGLYFCSVYLGCCSGFSFFHLIVACRNKQPILYRTQRKKKKKKLTDWKFARRGLKTLPGISNATKKATVVWFALQMNTVNISCQGIHMHSNY